MSRVVLTGFAGFIGSQILRDLLDKGYEVIGVDNLSEGSNKKNYADLLGKFTPLIMDIADPLVGEAISNIAGGPIDYIINCCAQSHVDRSFNQVEKFIKSNINGPINLANFAIKEKVKKFCQVSTDEVFAESAQPFTENSKITPQNAYSSSKAAAEMFLDNYRKAFGLPLVITNGANTYGPRQVEKIIPLSIQKLIKGDKIPLYKTKAQRMWLHVEDHSSGIIAAMEEGVIGERYCLAPSIVNELFTDELVGLICQIMGKNFEDFVKFVEDRPNYDLRYYMLHTKATQDLGWYPKKNIREELKKVIDWYLNEINS